VEKDSTMSYRSLLVHLDTSARCSPRVGYAATLASRFEAHVVGVAPTGVIDLPMEAGPGLLGLDVMSAALAGLRHNAEDRAEAFKRRCAALGVSSCEAIIDDAESASSLLRHSLSNDLVVVSQPDPDAADASAAQALVEQLVLYCARPTLVVPYAGTHAPIAERALVAWSGTRESARALADALPLLQRARQVHVVRCDAPNSEALERRLAQLESLKPWLRRHGIEAEVEMAPTAIDPGELLLSRAAELDAGLLVMGAYGHARWAERILGGVTQTVLRSMTLPVLMSH
jgi:nucleotide-binding universal stress UspA family protein